MFSVPEYSFRGTAVVKLTKCLRALALGLFVSRQESPFEWLAFTELQKLRVTAHHRKAAGRDREEPHSGYAGSP